MNIRDATEDDIEAMAEIYRHYVRTTIVTLEEHEPSTDTFRRDISKIFARGEPFLVVTRPEDGKVCGYAYAGPYNERSGYKFTCEDTIYLHRDYCGKGLGKRLLRALFQMLQTRSRVQVIAKMSILPEQKVEDLPSCRLHMSFGFRPIGRMTKVGNKFHKWIDVVLLQLDLEDVAL